MTGISSRSKRAEFNAEPAAGGDAVRGAVSRWLVSQFDTGRPLREGAQGRRCPRPRGSDCGRRRRGGLQAGSRRRSCGLGEQRELTPVPGVFEEPLPSRHLARGSAWRTDHLRHFIDRSKGPTLDDYMASHLHRLSLVEAMIGVFQAHEAFIRPTTSIARVPATAISKAETIRRSMASRPMRSGARC